MFRCSPTVLAQIAIMVVIAISLFPPNSNSLTVEKQALLEFKANLHDPLNYLESWNSSNSPCDFFGIQCDPATGKVTNISLIELNLTGNISPSLSNIQSLQYLIFAGNFHFGEIPNLSILRSLEVLDLSENHISGDFPVWVGNLTMLHTLNLGCHGIKNVCNDFKETKIPESIAKLKNLTELYLRGINLIGELPEWIFHLKHLTALDLANNKLSGKIPRSISQLNNLTFLALFFNNFIGELPREIANLTLLQDFDISGNQFHGHLPPEMGKLKNLISFQAYENYFSGEIPNGFAYLPFLSDFSVYRNNFSGNFPKEFGMFSPLSLIDISENEFRGEFPKYLCQKRKLQFLLALKNSFLGELPTSYSNCKSLTRIRVSDNLLSGNISDGLWALPHIGFIDLSHNTFTGRISPKISISTNLTQISLSNNGFSGELPQEIGSLLKLQRLVLSNNGFFGEIPRHIRYLKQLSSLQLDDNSFSGPIPSELGECISLSQINLAKNSFTGNIPDSISKLHLNSLNMSRNKLSGSIPQSLTNLKLSLIDLSKNLLCGVIPIELYIVGGDSGFLGNEQLCLPLNTMRPSDSMIKRCIVNQSPNRSNFHWLMFCYALLSTIALFIICILVLKIFHKLSLGKIYPTTKQDGEKEKDDRLWTHIIFQPRIEVKVSHMQRLKIENVIGRGSTGVVYKLDLNEEGQGIVAVKLLQGDRNKTRILKSFTKEIEILGNVRHKNILRLYAYFKKGRSHYLVLELMERGSLYQALHGESSVNQVLDFYTRYKIAVGVAQGIAYLHHDCRPPIIHRDIKSNNILLDEDYEPKVSDFGIAMCEEISSTTSSLVIGTHGYMAPELAYSMKATEKSDVYSFGVVLLELLTGRKPNEEEFGEGKDNVSWVQNVWYDSNGDQVLDQSVAATSTRACEGMRKMMDIALMCIDALPSARPSMRDVVNMLLD